MQIRGCRIDEQGLTVDRGRLTTHKGPGVKGLGNRGCGYLIVLEQFGANVIQFGLFRALGGRFAGKRRQKRGIWAFVIELFLNFLFRGTIATG
jgi:hypothetical protein